MLENVIAVISISPSLFGKEEHTEKPRQTEDKLDHNHTLKESRLLGQPAKMWVVCSREVCATQLVLAGRCADLRGMGGRDLHRIDCDPWVI